jgi:hypothetical protein
MAVLAITLTLLLLAGTELLSTPNSVLYQIAYAPGKMTPGATEGEQGRYQSPEDCDNGEDDDWDGLIDEKDALDCPNILPGGSSQGSTDESRGNNEQTNNDLNADTKPESSKIIPDILVNKTKGNTTSEPEAQNRDLPNRSTSLQGEVKNNPDPAISCGGTCQ